MFNTREEESCQVSQHDARPVSALIKMPQNEQLHESKK